MQHDPEVYRSILAYIRREADDRERTFVSLSAAQNEPLEDTQAVHAEATFAHACDLWEAGMIHVLTGRSDAPPTDGDGRPKQLLVGGLTERGRSFLDAARENEA